MSEQLNKEEAEILKTQRRVRYILETHITISDKENPDDVYAWMIARHIHKNFVLRDNVAHPTPNTADELHEILRELFLEAIKQGLDEYTKGHSDHAGPVMDKAKAALLAWRDSYTNEKVAAARVDEIDRAIAKKRMVKFRDNDSEEWFDGATSILYFQDRRAQLTNHKQNKEK